MPLRMQMDISVVVIIKPVQSTFWIYTPPTHTHTFLNQFYVPFNIISAHMRTANQKVGRKRENPYKTHLAHPQAELGLSHMWPERSSNPHQGGPRGRAVKSAVLNNSITSPL